MRGRVDGQAGGWNEKVDELTKMGEQATTQVVNAPVLSPTVKSSILQRKCDCGNHTIAGGECGECAKEKSTQKQSNKLPSLEPSISNRPIQPQLALGPCSDRSEQEADRIADSVSAGHSARAALGASNARLGQPAGFSGSTPASVGITLNAPGSPLDQSLRSDMETRFGHDFSRVRVHSGPAAEQSAREIGAHAYTSGHDIVFGNGKFEPATQAGRRLIAHELTHVVQQSSSRLNTASDNNSGTVQRTCGTALGKPSPDCVASSAGTTGWPFWFKVNCDELRPGGDENIKKLKTGSKLNIHGFASSDGTSDFNDALSCHRANRIAEMVRARRPDCPVLGVFKHGEGQAAAQSKGGPSADFWRNVTIEEIKRTPEEWLDPTSVISKAWTLLARAKNTPTAVNLGNTAAHRALLKTWLEGIPKSLAPAGAELDRKDLDDYRRLYDSAERVWQDIDKWLSVQGHSAAATDTYTSWASGSGTDWGNEMHAKGIPQGAKYHIDIFGEGFFPGSVNIGMAERTSTTRIPNTRVPNLIYRQFSGQNTNKIPIADHVADLVTSENGPLGMPGLADEIARIIAPGGTIVLYGPDNMEPEHDEIAKKTGGVVKKTRKDGGLETSITVPDQAQIPKP